MSEITDHFIERIYSLHSAMRRFLRDGDEQILRDAMALDEERGARFQLAPTRKAGARDPLHKTTYEVALANSGKGKKPTKKRHGNAVW